jgi:ketosteroid isomerase-like protein
VHTQQQIEDAVAHVFRALSSNGVEPVGDAFTEDGVYEGAYSASPDTADEDNKMVGRETISKLFHEVLPQVLSPFSQWADTIYPVTDGDTAIVEGRSDGIAVHDGSVYRNKYIWVMKFRDGKIELMREYFNVPKWHHAIGPNWQQIVDGVFNGELPMSGSSKSAGAAR